MATSGDDRPKELTSAEYRSFREHFADLFEGMQEPISLSVRLYSAGILHIETKRSVCSLERPAQQRNELLDALERQIRVDPQNFYRFVDKLEKDSPMQHLCDNLRSTCAQLKSNTTSSVTLPPNTSAQQIREHYTMPPSSCSPSSSSSSSHSSTAVTRNQYRVFLKDCYRQPLPDDDKLLTTASKHYIELAVISREGITRKDADEFTKKSLHGLTEEILHKKSPIALKDILKPREDGKPVRCVLVEGAPGIGKSTLAWEICHKWEELDSVKQYELVVLVRLREKRAQEARCLEDLLPCGAITKMKELVAAIGRGQGVLIVCDGFDELPHEQRHEGSVYIELLKGRLLPEAAIIVTSRPSVRSDLSSLCQHNIDRHLEVIGFTKENIKQFAESVFSGDILEGFLSYITSNPPIYGMMYIPLNTVIAALIYQDSYDTDTPFPTTMTQLFDALTRALIRRHLVSSHYKIDMPSSLQHIEDINKLPSSVAKQFLELARVAYESWHRIYQRFVFTDLGEDFEGLGMMKKTTSLNVCTGRECSYSFLHLTLQEYMAALYIAIVCPSCRDWGMFRSGRHDVIVRFLAGICRYDDDHSHCYQELVEHLDDRIEIYTNNYFAYPICNGRFNAGLLLLAHCVYECPNIMLNIGDKNLALDSFLEPRVGFDWYVTGYCFSHFIVKWGLSTEHATDDNIDLLVKGLRSSSTTKGKIQELHMHSSCKCLSQLKEFCQLQALCLCYVSIDNDDEVILCELIEHQGRLKRVDCCTHRNFKYAGTGSLIPVLLGQASLEELKIETCDISINTELLPHSNTTLKKLTIHQVLIQPLAALLPSITSLIYLEIDKLVADSDDDIRVLITTVQSLPMLEVLHLSVRGLTVFWTDHDDLSEIVVAAGISGLKELRLDSHYYDKLPQQIRENYNHLLKRTQFCIQRAQPSPK